MQIEVKGRNLQVTDEIKEYAEKRFERIAKQVSDLAVLELEVADENVPGDPIAADVVLRLKGGCGERRVVRPGPVRGVRERHRENP